MSIIYDNDIMRPELYDYDVFPLCFLTGESRTVTVRPLGIHRRFEPGHEYVLTVLDACRAEDGRFPGTGNGQTVRAVPDEDGCLRVSADFPAEGMYFIFLHHEAGGGRMAQFRVYALAHDMAGRIPLRGDLHLHSCRSDGREDPAVVVSHYRAHGYDFTVLSDHERYYPSLEARRRMGINENDESELTDMLIVPGEEVHLPLNDVHFVNFGGEFSINALLTPNRNTEGGDGREVRSLHGDCPDTMTRDEFIAMIRERAESVPREIESERLSYAVLEWTNEQMKANKGLGIFPHPYWLCSTMQLSDDYTRFIYEHRPFDAFEVLGGENYYQHNGFQTSLYYEMKAKGYDYPVVGSTDSHGSTRMNRNALICSTIVFAPSNTTRALVDSIKDYYSVAVDTISPEYRLVGDTRWVRFGSFLMENWYPLHDKVCEAEGLYLKRYVTGDDRAEAVLKAMKGQIPAMFRKYFAV